MSLAVSHPGPRRRTGPSGAVLACIGRFGLAKTTIDDIAREAGCSRATLYRYFDGKPEIVRSAVVAEHERIAGVVVAAGRGAATFADAVVAAVVDRGARAARRTTRCSSSSPTSPKQCSATSRSARATVVLIAVGDAIAPAFDRWLTPDDAIRAGDWLARIVRSYVLMPHPPIDLTDPTAARAFLEQFVIPGLAESR